MKKLLIWGAGDQGLVTLDYALMMKVYDQIDFLKIKEKISRVIPDYNIYEEDENLETLFKLYDEVIVATGDNHLREQKIKKLNALHIPLATIIHPSAIINSSAKVAQGSTIGAGAVININAFIGVGCIINTGAIVEHDCVIKDFVNICPGVAMAGHVTIAQKSYLGIGATIIDDIHIGENVMIGAGAVVIEDIPDDSLAVGVPAKLKQRKTI